MRVETRHKPSFGVARVLLTHGEGVQAAKSAMVASSYGVAVGKPWSNGPRGRGKAAVFSAAEGPGWVDLAPENPGDVHALLLDGRSGWCVATEAVLAEPETVRRDASWSGFAKLFGADVAFLEHVSGYGPVVLAGRGPIDVMTIKPGEFITVTPAHLVGYPDTMTARVRAVDPSGPQSVKTGQGLLVDLAGPGTVLCCARRLSGYPDSRGARG